MQANISASQAPFYMVDPLYTEMTISYYSLHKYVRRVVL